MSQPTDSENKENTAVPSAASGKVLQNPHPPRNNASVLFGFLHNKKGAYVDGYDPNSTPVFDAAGNLYGTTQCSGVPGNCETAGTAFKLTPGRHG